jgi:predicted phosphodiesterase
MNGRILILSDTHLGRSRWCARSAEALRPLWEGCDHLVINGDVAEVHHPTHWGRAARAVMRLFDLCESDGVHVTLLSGNHDPYITDLRHLHLAGGQVFVTHGDVLHPAVAPWSPAAARMRTAHEAALAAIDEPSRDQLESRLSASQLAAHAEWEQLAEEALHSRLRGMLVRPWALLEVLRYWRTIPAIAHEFLVEHAPKAKFMVLGHTHREGIWRFGSQTIINTGSFGFPGHPWAVVIEPGIIRVLPVTRIRGRYRLGDIPLLQGPLDAVPRPSAENTLPGSAFPSTLSM